MKKFIKMILVSLSFVVILTLTGCKDDFITPTLEDVRAVALRTTVNLTFTTMDEDDMLTELKVTITGEHDGEEYTETKSVTISGGSYADEEDVEQDSSLEYDQFLGEDETLSFTGLQIGEKYTLSFVGTYNDKVKTMYDDVVVNTSEKGGSEETAWEITTYEELNTLVRDDNDGYFKLMNDVDCANADTDKAQELKPFFSSSKKFEGNFNGQGFTISNFYQDSYDQDLGLFGNIGSAGEVYDFNVKNVDISSSRYTNFYAGAIVGTNTGVITDVHVTNVTITTKGPDDGNQFVGGFVGQNKESGTITNCSVTTGHLNLNVPSNGRIGGFAGTNEASTKVPSIIDCSSNILIDVQVPTNPAYSSDDEGVEIVLSIGGFIGDNRGYISGSETNSKILVYVDKTQTDYDNNTDEFEDDNLEVENTDRLTLIGQIDLNIGGFVGNNLAGSIINSTTTTNEVIVDMPYADLLRVGGFAGYNDSFANISDCLINATANYNIIVGEDTILNEEVKDNTEFDDVNHTLTMNYIGTFIGLNNNETTVTIDDIKLSNGSTVSITVTLRTSYEKEIVPEGDDADDSEDAEAEYETIYEFNELKVILNTILK